ncbi:MAG: hypothetical protein AAFP07_01540 [Cyanobacteria bacterium J06606_4]
MSENANQEKAQSKTLPNSQVHRTPQVASSNQSIAPLSRTSVPPPPNLTADLRSKVPYRASIAGDLGKAIVDIFTWSIKASFFIAAGLLVVTFLSGLEITKRESATGEVVTTYDYNPEDADTDSAFEVFKTVSSVMAGPLGFVLGFYFREERDR